MRWRAASASRSVVIVAIIDHHVAARPDKGLVPVPGIVLHLEADQRTEIGRDLGAVILDIARRIEDAQPPAARHPGLVEIEQQRRQLEFGIGMDAPVARLATAAQRDQRGPVPQIDAELVAQPCRARPRPRAPPADRVIAGPQGAASGRNSPPTSSVGKSRANCGCALAGRKPGTTQCGKGSARTGVCRNASRSTSMDGFPRNRGPA